MGIGPTVHNLIGNIKTLILKQERRKHSGHCYLGFILVLNDRF